MTILFNVFKFLPYYFFLLFITKSIIEYKKYKSLEGENIFNVLSSFSICLLYTFTFLHLQLSYNKQVLNNTVYILPEITKPLILILVNLFWVIISLIYTTLIVNIELFPKNIGLATIITFALPFFIIL